MPEGYRLLRVAGGKKKKRVKVKKRCCESKRRCVGCPLRPENRGRRERD